MRVDCPKCHLKVDADLDDQKPFKFLLYRCICCKSIVVYYNGKITTVSERVIKRLSKRYKLSTIKVCPAHSSSIITEDKIKELRSLLETETDFDRLLSKL